VEGEDLERKASLLQSEGVHLIEPESVVHKTNANVKSSQSSRDVEGGKKAESTPTSNSSKAQHRLNFSSAVIDSTSILDGDSLQEAILKAREERQKGFTFPPSFSSTRGSDEHKSQVTL